MSAASSVRADVTIVSGSSKSSIWAARGPRALPFTLSVCDYGLERLFLPTTTIVGNARKRTI
uniref:Uncharacterized protein n=1 Tax=Moniliophthora roreri TaxID=221103 RepID=A0A0W0F842_MONRR